VEGKSEQKEEPPLAGPTLMGEACIANTTTWSRIHEFYKICPDNGSPVNIVDPHLLTNLCMATQTFRSMNWSTESKRMGHLDGFFDCQACEGYPANILSMADIEDRHPITYVQGTSITVHMDDCAVLFIRRNKMSVWGRRSERRLR
jgi:hypothetical protein